MLGQKRLAGRRADADERGGLCLRARMEQARFSFVAVILRGGRDASDFRVRLIRLCGYKTGEAWQRPASARSQASRAALC